MTDGADKVRRPVDRQASSTLPFDPAQLMGMRVRPAQFAKMCGVSKQAVSQWIQRGTITLLPDGTLDPVKASRQVVDNSDPTRLRARIFKTAMQSRDDLTERIKQLESKVDALKEKLRAVRTRARDDEAARVARFCSAIEDHFEGLVRAERAGELEAQLDDLAAWAFGWNEATEPTDAPPTPDNAFPSPEFDGASKGAGEAAEGPAPDCSPVSPAKDGA